MKKKTNEEGVDELEIQTSDIRMGANIFRAIDHGLRREILYFIHKQGKVIVTDIYVGLKLNQSLTSQHLSILRGAGLVKTSNEGRRVYYSVDEERIGFLMRKAGELVEWEEIEE